MNAAVVYVKGMAGPTAVLRALRTLRPRSASGFPSPAESILTPVSRAPYPPWGTCPVRTLRLCSALCAGHNKWSKVKNIKGPRDEARAKIFAKLGMMIRVAVREGGPNPDMNINLAHILEQCRSNNMPKASIETAIKGSEKAKPALQQIFEVRGPGGCLLLIEVLTDNSTRSHNEIKRLLNKNGGMFLDGSRLNFSRKGMVVVPGQNISTERALELAIEAGAEDVQESEDEEEKPVLQFTCDIIDLRKVRASLEKLGVPITSAGLEFIPRNRSCLNPDQLDAASTLIEVLTDFPDVVRVWDNIQADS